MKRRILIIRLSALGDIVHALPVLSALRREHPDAHLGWLVEDRGASIIQNHPMLDAVHVLPRKAFRNNPFSTMWGPMRDLVAELKTARYETVIDLQGLTKSAIWTKMCGASRRIGFGGEGARELSSMFYTTAIHPRADQIHIVKKNMSLLRPLELEEAEVRFDFPLGEENKIWGQRVWGETGDQRPRIVMNPGAGWKTKQWPAASYGRLAQRFVRELDARVALAWGPGEEALVGAALEAIGEDSAAAAVQSSNDTLSADPGVYPLPASTFMQLGGAIEGAHLYVGGDTGPTHLASALGKPTLGIFGASDALRNGPWGGRCDTIQLDEPSCIPCWKKECDWQEPLACLTRISVEAVFDLAVKLLTG